MEQIIKHIDLNVRQPNNYNVIHVMQGTNHTVVINATIYDGNKRYNTSDMNVSLILLDGVTPAGKKIDTACTLEENGTISFTLTNNMLCIKGVLHFSIVMIDAEGNALPTFPFSIRVHSDLSETAQESEVTAITDLVLDAQRAALIAGEKAEDAGSYARQARSYVHGDTGLRENEHVDNAKYYYEQIQTLLDDFEGGTESGHRNIVYYDTYEAFQSDLDAGNIANETLICIGQNPSHPDNPDPDNPDTPDPDNPEQPDTPDNPEQPAQTLLLFAYNGKKWMSNNMNTWTYMNEDKYALALNEEEGSEKGYQFVMCNNMIFCLISNSTSARLFYTLHDISSCDCSTIFKEASNFSLNQGNGKAHMAYGNNHLMIFHNGIGYVIHDNIIQDKRINDTGVMSNLRLSDFTQMPQINNKGTDLVYGNGIFVLVGAETTGSTTIGKSWYTSDGQTWNELGQLHSSLNGSGVFDTKLVYGNGLFVHLSNSASSAYKFAILDSNNLNEGWYYSDVETDSSTQVTDIIFDEKSNTFLAPYYNTNNNTSGFYIYDGTSWAKTTTNGVFKLYNCISYNGKIYGFLDNNHWISVNDRDTYQYTDYGTLTTEGDSASELSGFYCRYAYAALDAPLWDIDNETDT